MSIYTLVLEQYINIAVYC